MKHLVFLTFALFALPANVAGQSGKPPTPEGLAEIAARGRALAEYDQAAWHASDAVQALHPTVEAVQRYVARKTPGGWIVAWGAFDKSHTRFLISYEAIQGAKPDEFTVSKHDPPQEDTDFFFHAASALEAARADFSASSHPACPYNLSVLPAPNGAWYVYAIPGQQYTKVLPYGGDVRYTISSDGSKILDRRRMHQVVHEDPLPAGGGGPEFGYHTHVMSDSPEDSDIFYAMTRRAEQGEWVATRAYTYQISPGFALGLVGETKDVAEALSKRDCHLIQAQAALCADKADATRLRVLSTLWRLTGVLPEEWPLEANVAFENARCKDGQIWLTLTVSLRNVGDSDVVVSRAMAGNWIQARFAGSPADLISGKYDKLLFVALDPKFDPSKDDSFAPLSPGKEIQTSKDVFLADLDPRGKNVAQFLIFTWLTNGEKPGEQIRKRFAPAGNFYTEPVMTGPMPFTLDPKLVEGCRK
jgi:hypothetical protein